jgi:hypothetical protein
VLDLLLFYTFARAGWVRFPEIVYDWLVHPFGETVKMKMRKGVFYFGV